MNPILSKRKIVPTFYLDLVGLNLRVISRIIKSDYNQYSVALLVLT